MRLTGNQVRTIEGIIRSINNVYGAGEVRAVVFPLVPYAGVSQHGGLVVSQQQYGMKARKFRFTDRQVTYLGRRRVFAPKRGGTA